MRLPFRLSIALLAATAASAAAQDLPARPVTLLVPFAAGGPTDTIARILADSLKGPLGRTVVVENVLGGAGSAGAARGARATPDGSLVTLGNIGTHVFNGAMHNLAYDLVDDFQPVAFITDNPLMIVGRSTLPPADLQSLMSFARANPGLTAGTSGVGAPSQVSGLYFQKLTGTELRYVPYRGAGPALQDVVSGRIDLMFDQVANSLPHVRSGNVRAYAVAARERTTSAPDIPTVDEAGLPGFHVSAWHGVWAPKGTPAPLVEKLHAAISQTLDDPAIRQRLTDLGQQIVPREQRTPSALRAHQRAEIDKWWPIIKRANIHTQ